MEIDTRSAEELVKAVGDDCFEANQLIDRYFASSCLRAKEALILLLDSPESHIAAIAYCGLLKGPHYPRDSELMKRLSDFKKDPIVRERGTIELVVNSLKRYRLMHEGDL